MNERNAELVAILVQLTGGESGQVADIVCRPWAYYRSAVVRKKYGGTRRISVPADPLKHLQRKLLNAALRRLENHPANHCRRGRSVITNARVHAGQAYVATFDLKSAFPSTRPYMVLEALRRQGISEITAQAVTRFCTLRRELPQGAPTSPALLSAVLRPVDDLLTAEARRHGIRYTRYMDDLFFSAGRRIRSFAAVIRQAVRNAGYRVSEDKSRRWGPRQRATLAGVVLGTTFSPTDEFMKTVEVVIQKLETGELMPDGNTIARLEGMVAWVRALDAARGLRLRARMYAACGLAQPSSDTN